MSDINFLQAMAFLAVILVMIALATAKNFVRAVLVTVPLVMVSFVLGVYFLYQPIVIIALVSIVAIVAIVAIISNTSVKKTAIIYSSAERTAHARIASNHDLRLARETTIRKRDNYAYRIAQQETASRERMYVKALEVKAKLNEQAYQAVIKLIQADARIVQNREGKEYLFNPVAEKSRQYTPVAALPDVVEGVFREL